MTQDTGDELACRMPGVRIIGTGSALPSRVVTNDDLAQIVDTSDEWISTRTGIRSRPYCDTAAGESHRTLVRDAAARALEAAGIEPAEVGICLVATFTPELSTPSAACLVQRDLGLPEDALCLDLNAACAGFVYGLHVAESLLATAPRPYALVVGADCLSRVMDFTDRSTCVLFGDGAGAAVLARAEGAPSLHAVWGSRGNDEALWAPGLGAEDPAYLHMDGRAVFRFATEVLPRVTEQVPARAGNIDHTGNTSAGSVPVLLDELVRAGELGPGSRVLMAGFGAGLTWAGCLAELG